jgi:uncharacterized protein (TIGR03083 family)
MIDHGDLDAIAREGRRAIELARAAPDARPRQYPSWTLVDLVVHLGGVHGRTAEICRTLPKRPIPTATPPAEADPVGWAEERLEEMLDALARADPEAHVWTFVDDRRLAFWGPRMVVETGVHRWDAEDAVGQPQPLLDIVAERGLDEFGALYLPRLGRVPTIELYATDLGRRWHYGQGRAGMTVEDTASGLFLRLMARPGALLPPAWSAAVDALPSPSQ